MRSGVGTPGLIKSLLKNPCRRPFDCTEAERKPGCDWARYAGPNARLARRRVFQRTANKPWIGGRISEKLLYRLSGGLFLAFGLFSLKQALA